MPYSTIIIPSVLLIVNGIVIVCAIVFDDKLGHWKIPMVVTPYIIYFIFLAIRSFLEFSRINAR